MWAAVRVPMILTSLTWRRSIVISTRSAAKLMSSAQLLSCLLQMPRLIRFFARKFLSMWQNPKKLGVSFTVFCNRGDAHWSLCQCGGLLMSCRTTFTATPSMAWGILPSRPAFESWNLCLGVEFMHSSGRLLCLGFLDICRQEFFDLFGICFF